MENKRLPARIHPRNNMFFYFLGGDIFGNTLQLNRQNLFFSPVLFCKCRDVGNIAPRYTRCSGFGEERLLEWDVREIIIVA